VIVKLLICSLTVSCRGSGVETARPGSTDHSFTVADLDATYTIICQDVYGNEMAPVSVNLGYSES